MFFQALLGEREHVERGGGGRMDGAVRPHRQGHDPRPHLLPPAHQRMRIRENENELRTRKSAQPFFFSEATF